VHRLSYYAVFAAILCAAPAGTAAADPDSTVSVVHTPSPTEQFTLYLERDGTRNAVYVEPRADGMVAITWMDSTLGYVPLYRIRRIEDAQGADRTSEVIGRGHRLGAPVLRPAHGPEGWKRYRFRAGPPSECGSYLITDFALMWRTAPLAGYPRRDDEMLGTFDCGYARNVGRSNSIGGSVFLGGSASRTHAGLRLRLCSWLAPNVSFDIAPGIVLLADEGGSSRFVAPGFSGQAGLTFSGRFGFVAQVISVKWREYRFENTDTDLHVGFRLGAEPGIAMGAAFTVAKAIQGTGHTFRPTTP